MSTSSLKATPVHPLTFRGDGAPRLRWIHEGSVLDLLRDVLVFVEGERARQRHVNYHAHRPHVQGAIVAFIAEYFWCCNIT